MARTAQKAFDRLSEVQQARLCALVFEVLEYDEDGNPGSEWSSDTTQALGELFLRWGVTFTPPQA